MGHGTELMIEQRYGRYAKFSRATFVLEFRCEHWKARCGDLLALGLARLLKPGHHEILAVLVPYQ
jgi:hypothetical protein